MIAKRNILLYCIAVAMLLMVLATTGCRNQTEPTPDPEVVQLEKLAKVWKASSVTRDGAAQTGYNNLQLTLSGNAGSAPYQYAVAGRPELSPWRSSGTWVFGSNVETTVVRDDGTADELEISYTLNGSQLQLNFNFSGTGFTAGRTQSVAGAWVFTFTQQ